MDLFDGRRCGVLRLSCSGALKARCISSWVDPWDDSGGRNGVNKVSSIGAIKARVVVDRSGTNDGLVPILTSRGRAALCKSSRDCLSIADQGGSTCCNCSRASLAIVSCLCTASRAIRFKSSSKFAPS